MRGKNLLKLMACSLLIAGCQSSKPEIVQKKQNNDAISINFLTGSLQKDVYKRQV